MVPAAFWEKLIRVALFGQRAQRRPRHGKLSDLSSEALLGLRLLKYLRSINPPAQIVTLALTIDARRAGPRSFCG